MKLVLASRSPRRTELLNQAGIPHTVRVADVDETILAGEKPLDYVRRVAEAKAQAVERREDEIVLAADTSVVCDGEVLGKPLDEEDARRMLRLLSGKRHEVITGICLRYHSGVYCSGEVTGVWFSGMSEREIEEYAASGEPMDKAGAYAIQGLASRYVQRIEGSYSNVVGLPVALVWRQLERLRSFPF